MTYVFTKGKGNSKIAINANDMKEAKLAYVKLLIEQGDLIGIFGYPNDSICEEDSITEVYNASEYI